MAEEPKWLRYKKWLEAMGALRPSTIASHVSIAKNFEETVNDFSEDGIVRFMSKVSPNSKGQYRAALINFLTYLGRDDLARYLKMSKSRIGKKYVDWYWTEEEVQKLIEACGDNLRHRIIVKLAYYLALRRREISELRVRDIDFKNMTVRVTLAKKAGTVYMQKPLYKDLADDIKQYIKETGKKPDDRLIDMHPVAVSYAVYNLSKKAGIRPAHIHKLRHCIHPNTRVVVPEGVLPAKMLYFRHSPIMAYDFNNLKVVEAEVVDKTVHVSDKLVAILAGGRELICTPEHRVFRLRNGKIEEVEAGKLSVGDYIAGVRRIEVPNRRKIFEPKLWRILGYIIGDGYVHGTAVIITEKREDIANYYLNLARELGLSSNLKKYKDRKSHLLSICSTALVDLTVSLGVDKKSPDRRVPTELFHATDEEIVEFIAGFYDAEGLEVRKEREFPRFFSTSKEMLKDIQMLLLYFGVHSNLRKMVRKVKTPHGKIYEQHKMYEICIAAGDEIEKFSKLIPTLKTVNVTSTRSKRRHHDIIPVVDVLKQIYERRLREGKIVVKYGAALSKYVRELRNPSRNVLANLLKIIEDELEYKFLKGLVEGNIMWLKVTKIERTGGNARYIKAKELSVGHYLVYDFDVPQYNTLITDGIISHNSRVAHLRLKGVPLDVLSKFLGHEKLDTTMIYAHIGPPVIQKEIPPPFT